MSVVLTLTSCAIIAGLSITQTAAMALVVKDDDELEENINEGLETQFVDSEILIKTLQGFDCHFEQIDENQINVQTTCGNLIYKRDAVGEAFKLYMDEINVLCRISGRLSLTTAETFRRIPTTISKRI